MVKLISIHPVAVGSILYSKAETISISGVMKLISILPVPRHVDHFGVIQTRCTHRRAKGIEIHGTPWEALIL